MKNADTFKITTPSDTEIAFTRLFNAPRQLVWDAMHKPELVRKWLFGPVGWTMTVCEGEPIVGGTFRWEWQNVDGRAMAMTGTFTEVQPPEKVVRVERFEFGCEAQAGEQLGTMLLVEEGKLTRMNLVVRYPSKEARDGALASGMEHGMAAGYDRLDALLVS
jgi:uncharacterized protein YndB with AHSA1/START domain